jgi:hypothetical protein
MLMGVSLCVEKKSKGPASVFVPVRILYLKLITSRDTTHDLACLLQLFPPSSVSKLQLAYIRSKVKRGYPLMRGSTDTSHPL